MPSPPDHDRPAAPAVQLCALAAGYPGGPDVLVVDELELAAGTMTALIGANGAGKSTLLLVIAGLLRPRRGQVRVLGTAPTGREVAVVFQASPQTAELPLTVDEVVAMGRFPHRGLLRRFRAEDRTAVTRALERCDAQDLATRQLAELSGGQRQRVLLARALAQEASVLLLDEPTAGLDRGSQQRIRELLDEERRAGVSVVCATHDPLDAELADRVLAVATQVVADGSAAQVLGARSPVWGWQVPPGGPDRPAPQQRPPDGAMPGPAGRERTRAVSP